MDLFHATEHLSEVGAVEAALNYLAPGVDRPFVYAYEPPPAGEPQRHGSLEPHAVTILDARPLVRQLSLDEQGFALRRHQTAVADFYDEAEVRRVYYPEVEALLRAETGAEKVVIFDHTVRNTGRGRAGATIREAGASVHNDYTEASAPRRVRQLLPAAEAEARLQRRYAEINVWRPIAGPVESWPLALCDARSMAWSDLVVSERRYPDRVGETYQARFNPRHRWLYFPRMQRDEALLLKCFDSATDGRARLAIHSAFDDPSAPANAAPRESIEVRAFVFF